MFINARSRYRRSGPGQSMVEFALVLPLLLLIMAGVLEVGNLLTLYNRVSLAAREGARFIATGGDAVDVVEVIEQNSAGSLYFAENENEEDHACVYVIHGEVNSSGDGWESWTDPANQVVYPTSIACPADPNGEGSGVNQDEVLEQISDAPHGSADIANLKVVVVAMRYNADTLLSLPIFPQLQGRVPIQAFTAMRLEATIEEAAGKPTDGCHAYPIAIHEDALSFEDRTVYQAFQKEEFDLARYGDHDEWDEDNLFTYLLWNDDHTVPDCGANFDAVLAASLGYPGNTFDTTCGYVSPTDDTDTELHRGDQVLINGSPDSQTLAAMADHICPTGDPDDCGRERALRIMVWDEAGSNPGSYIKVKDFIIVRPTDIEAGEEDGTPYYYLTFEFLRFDRSCGKSSS